MYVVGCTAASIFDVESVVGGVVASVAGGVVVSIVGVVVTIVGVVVSIVGVVVSIGAGAVADVVGGKLATSDRVVVSELWSISSVDDVADSRSSSNPSCPFVHRTKAVPCGE